MQPLPRRSDVRSENFGEHASALQPLAARDAGAQPAAVRYRWAAGQHNIPATARNELARAFARCFPSPPAYRWVSRHASAAPRPRGRRGGPLPSRRGARERHAVLHERDVGLVKDARPRRAGGAGDRVRGLRVRRARPGGAVVRDGGRGVARDAGGAPRRVLRRRCSPAASVPVLPFRVLLGSVPARHRRDTRREAESNRPPARHRRDATIDATLRRSARRRRARGDGARRALRRPLSRTSSRRGPTTSGTRRPRFYLASRTRTSRCGRASSSATCASRRTPCPGTAAGCATATCGRFAKTAPPP